MTKWKLTRQFYGKEEYNISEGEVVTIGRGLGNKITLSSIVISRNHCELIVRDHEVVITDLKSSNGVYVGLNKIPPNSPYTLKDSDVIGLGWNVGAIANINDNEKYIFKLHKLISVKPIGHTAVINNSVNVKQERDTHSPILDCGLNTKRKSNIGIKKEVDVKEEHLSDNSNGLGRYILYTDDEVIDISDSESEVESKRLKLCQQVPTKIDKEDFEYDPFNVKQEFFYDDDPIEIDSDEDNPLILRLSQSSPGKPLTPVRNKKLTKPDENSYSQLEGLFDDEDEYAEDIISIPPVPPEDTDLNEDNVLKDTFKDLQENLAITDTTYRDSDHCTELQTVPDVKTIHTESSPKTLENIDRDEVDGICRDEYPKEAEESVPSGSSTAIPSNEKNRKAQMIDPLENLRRRKSHTHAEESKSKSSSKHEKKSHKRHISDSQKEERKKRLKEIASKDKEEHEKSTKSSSSSSKQDKGIKGVKVTTANRSAFLTEETQITTKPTKRRDSPRRTKNKENPKEDISSKDSPKQAESVGESKQKSKRDKSSSKSSSTKNTTNIDNKLSTNHDSLSESKSKSHRESKKITDQNNHNDSKNDKLQRTLNNNDVPKNVIGTNSSTSASDLRVPLKSLKPLSENEDIFSGKPYSKVEPLTHRKAKKTVRFSDKIDVQEFQIEDGNKMRKTSSVKNMDVMKQAQIFSLEKISLMKILRWNPLWLEEQKNYQEPPPILGHSNTPTMLHTFTCHNQYVQTIGDLLLMEVWECLTQGHMRLRGQNGMNMVIESLPPIPAQDRHFDLFNVSVKISVPNADKKFVPRSGELLIVDLRIENARRFFFVSNVRNLPSHGNTNVYGLSLLTCYTEKMKFLQQGHVISGWTLAFIQKELMLFDAMEYLASSPLSEAILNPEPRHFVINDCTSGPSSVYTNHLNPSQRKAVQSSVCAALSDRPSLQMVQGPPGSGKSSVICAMILSYFYGSKEKKQPNRGKILICATSNAAVDELVIRMLNIRQNLPKAERFRMVRVGRAEAMHPRALEVSSQTLAQRDAAARAAHEPAHGTHEEISHLQAKINMWKSQAQDPKIAPERVAYCLSQVSYLNDRIAMLRSPGGAGAGALAGEQLTRAERRIIEGADIVVTTLASAQNHKMRGLKNRIALCIVDEAGQAIEPETLIPLTLGVTKITLIGDPQQLPGFICSQRAKKHGLGESLFFRLTSYSESWPERPLVLLNHQYRMHRDIADYPNRAFYNGLIQTMPPTRPEINIPPYSIISISSGDKGQVQGANQIEARAVARIALALSTTLAARLSLAVITPYNAHKDLIKEYLKTMQDKLKESDPSYKPGPAVEVNTVDSFQGQERDVVVVSLARSHGVGFLTDAGRMNVMLTRAKHALLVCLNPHAMIRHHQWKTLVEDAQNRNLLRLLPKKLYQQPLPSTVAEVEDILTHIREPNAKSRK